MLTRAEIRGMARVVANDTDTTNPLWSDANVNLLINSCAADLATFLRFPRHTVPVTEVVGTYEYDLPSDWLATISITEFTAGANATKLSFKDEQDVEAADPDWRNDDNGQPRHWFIGTNVTDGTTFARKLTISPPPAVARTLRHTYVRAPNLSQDTYIPPFAPALHILFVYYVAGHMLANMNPGQASVFLERYYSERKRLAFNSGKENEDTKIVFK